MPTFTNTKPKLKSNIKPPPMLIECTSCHRRFYLQNIEFRHIDFSSNGQEIIDVGFTCPHCQAFHHSYYINDDLDRRQKRLTNNRQRRAFQRDFDKWQAEVKELLATKLPIAEPTQV